MATLTENFNLQHALLCHLRAVPAVRILQRTKVTSIQSDGEQHGSWPLVHLDNQQVLRARLLVRICLLLNILKAIESFRSERTVLIRQSGRLPRYLRMDGHMMLKLSLLQWYTLLEVHLKNQTTRPISAFYQQGPSLSFH
jgi:hypothetical protein